MAQALVDHYSGSTALKAGHVVHGALLKDVLRPVDSFSSLEGVRVGSTPCVEDAAWTVSDSRSLYAVKGWGGPYFSVDDVGRLRVKPAGATLLCLGCHETAHPELDGWYRSSGADARKYIAPIWVARWCCSH